MDNTQIKNFIEQSRQAGIKDDRILSYLKDKGVDLSQQVQQEQKPSILEKGKALAGGFASGVGGIALTAEDYLARKGVFGEKIQKSLEGQPSLQEQFKQEMGGDKSPTLYGIGQLGGEVASLATPVSALGTATKTGTEAILAGTKASKYAKPLSKLAQAGVEGVAFTAGQSLQEGEKMSLQDYALNAGINIAFPAAGIVAKKAGEILPSKIVNSLIKPLAKDFAYGKNPGKTVSELGIVANDFDELVGKIRTAKEEAGNTIGTLRSKSTVQAELNPATILAPIDEAIAQASLTPRTNASVLARLDDVRQDILENMQSGLPPEKVKGLVGELTKWTGNASDDKLVNKTLKTVYGKINGEMDNALKQGLSPEEFTQYKKANEQYGDLISAENASIYRDKILERQNLISFGSKNAGLLTGLGVAISTGGLGLPAFFAGLGGAALDTALATPAFKTRLAALLSKLAPKDVKTFFDKVPTAKQLFDEKDVKSLINKIDEMPNKQGGFIKLPYDGSNPKTTTNSLTNVATKSANNSSIPKTIPQDETIVKSIQKAKASGMSFDEWVKGQITESPDYAKGEGSGHTAPFRDDYNAPAHELTKIYPDDVYEKGAQYYGSGYKELDNEAMSILRKVKDNPDAEITIYRAVPKGQNIKDINPGDWITLTKGYAKEHGISNLNGKYEIISKKVKADEVFTDANSLQEFGYDPRRLTRSQLKAEWDKVKTKK